MSFIFSWPTFTPGFYDDAKEMLSTALNKGEKPPLIADRIDVRELDMGTIPPELEMLEIGDLSKERFRGIFRLTYAGDAFIELQTAIQANPLTTRKPTLDAISSPSMLFASAPLRVPMRLRLSALRLRAIVVLVVSKAKGITLVFKNDPLESVTVSSTFDSVAVIQGFIQREIEGQLREMFRADLPGIIHRLSQRWLAENAKMDEARSRFDSAARIETRTETSFENSTSSLRIRPSHPALAHSSLTTSPKKLNNRASTPHLIAPKLASDLDAMSVADSIESYDPSYGLRPEGLPAQTPVMLRGGLSLPAARTMRGLGEVLEAESEDEEAPDADESYDFVSTNDVSSYAGTAYESYPAVGGGTITRPRILHSQSQMSVSSRAPSEAPRSRSPLDAMFDEERREEQMQRPPISARSASFAGRYSPLGPAFAHAASRSASSVSSMASPRTTFSRGASSLLLPTSASSHTTMSPPRSPSPPPTFAAIEKPPSPPPLLSPATQGLTLTTAPNNDRCAHLSTLRQTHSTLSPLTRQHEHVAARTHVLSRAHRGEGISRGAVHAPKARRRRIHVLGGTAKESTMPPTPPISNEPTVDDWEGSDYSDYFRRKD